MNARIRVSGTTINSHQKRLKKPRFPALPACLMCFGTCLGDRLGGVLTATVRQSYPATWICTGQKEARTTGSSGRLGRVARNGRRPGRAGQPTERAVKALERWFQEQSVHTSTT